MRSQVRSSSQLSSGIILGFIISVSLLGLLLMGLSLLPETLDFLMSLVYAFLMVVLALTSIGQSLLFKLGMSKFWILVFCLLMTLIALSILGITFLDLGEDILKIVPLCGIGYL